MEMKRAWSSPLLPPVLARSRIQLWSCKQAPTELEVFPTMASDAMETLGAGLVSMALQEAKE